ncbi:MAG: tetratricopeptide repeat protein [Holosporales bacterium]
MQGQNQGDNEFFQEVTEDVRRDQLLQLWQKWGNVLIGSVVFILLSASGFVWWQHQQENKLLARTASFEKALEEVQAGNSERAIELFRSLSASHHDGLAVLAMLEQAAVPGVSFGERISLYDQITQNTSYPTVFRELATLLAVSLQVQDGDPKTLLNTIEPLARGNGAWRASAQELKALLLVRSGAVDQARALFNALAEDEAATQGIRARATAFAQSL